MPNYYNTIEDDNGNYVTSNHVRYSVVTTDPALVHIPAGRETEMVVYNSVEEFLSVSGLEHVDDHAFPEPETEPIYVPLEVTNYQIKQALNTVPADRAAVDALVAGSGDQNTIDGWAHAAVFKSDNALFQGAVAYLGWSQEKVDTYLILAVTFD